MPTYRITDPNTGKTLRITGDTPPTEAELNQIFDAQQPPQPTQSTQPERPTGGFGAFPLVGGILGGTVGSALGPAGTIAGGGLGTATGKIAQESLQDLLGRQDQPSGEQVKGVLGQGGSAALLSAIPFARPGRILGGLRNTALQKAMEKGAKISAGPILQSVDDAARTALPGTRKSAERAAAEVGELLKNLIDDGSLSLDKAMNLKSQAADIARRVSGDLKETGAAKVNEAIAKNIREQIKNVAPMVSAIDRYGFQPYYAAGRMLTKTLPKIGYSVGALGGGAAILGKLLGIF